MLHAPVKKNNLGLKSKDANKYARSNNQSKDHSEQSVGSNSQADAQQALQIGNASPTNLQLRSRNNRRQQPADSSDVIFNDECTDKVADKDLTTPTKEPAEL